MLRISSVTSWLGILSAVDSLHNQGNSSLLKWLPISGALGEEQQELFYREQRGSISFGVLILIDDPQKCSWRPQLTPSLELRLVSRCGDLWVYLPFRHFLFTSYLGSRIFCLYCV